MHENQRFILREVADLIKQLKDKYDVFNKFNFAGGIGAVSEWGKQIPDLADLAVPSSSKDLDGFDEHPVSQE